jgi:hypothetical protein
VYALKLVTGAAHIANIQLTQGYITHFWQCSHGHDASPQAWRAELLSGDASSTRRLHASAPAFASSTEIGGCRNGTKIRELRIGVSPSGIESIGVQCEGACLSLGITLLRKHIDAATLMQSRSHGYVPGCNLAFHIWCGFTSHSVRAAVVVRSATLCVVMVAVFRAGVCSMSTWSTNMRARKRWALDVMRHAQARRA